MIHVLQKLSTYHYQQVMAHSLIVVCAFTIFLILLVKKKTHIAPKQQLQIHNQSPD